jgi:putative transposase
MRQKQSTLKASSVHAQAKHLLRQALDEEPHEPILPLGVVAAVLILAACWQTSLTGACNLVKDKPSHRQVRQALYACLPPRPRDLLSRLLNALRQTLPDDLFWRPVVMVLDLHQRPYYGKKNTKGCTQRQKKASKRKSFTYGTLAALDGWGGRHTVGLLATRPHMRLTTIVGQLLEQADTLGLTLAYLMLDKEFYCAEVIDLLQKRQIAFLMPARKKGSKGTGNSWLFEPDCPVGWHAYTWTTDLRRLDFRTKKRHKRGTLTVQVQMCVTPPAKKKAVRNKTSEQSVYVTWGLGKGWSPALVVAAYRRRFGIETQYRQLGQCLARTSSRNERLRLLLVGLALLLCNLWACLHSQVFSTGPLGAQQRRLGALPLLPLIAAVAQVSASLFGGYLDQWSIQRLLPLNFTTFQM